MTVFLIFNFILTCIQLENNDENSTTISVFSNCSDDRISIFIKLQMPHIATTKCYDGHYSDKSILPPHSGRNQGSETWRALYDNY